ncbi:MAG: AI-2E family transporter [Leptospirales bacterium]|nr:AI-2E family transporter [Leptospirales bacterium]
MIENQEKSSLDLSARIVQVIFFGLTAAFLLLTLYGIKELSIPIAISFLLTLLLNPLVDFLEGLDCPRLLATFIVFILFILFMYTILSWVVPLIQMQVQEIVQAWPDIQKKSNALFTRFNEMTKASLPSFIKMERLRMDTLTTMMETSAKNQAQGIKDNLGVIVSNLIITPIITFIFLLQGEEIYQRIIRMVPNRYFEMTLSVAYKVKSQITGYLRGLAVQLLINVALFSVGFMIIGLNYGFTLGVVAGSLNFIPYIGPVIGILPALAIAIQQGGNTTLFVLLVFGIAHLFDNVFTQPVILARSAELHPLIAILALITCERLFGVVGMIIAIPLAGILLVTIEVMYNSLKSFRII